MADDGKHECPVPRCVKRVAQDKLMCLPHWKRVPADIQREVWSTWRRVHRDPQAYRDAREKAIDAVTRNDPASDQGSMFE